MKISIITPNFSSNCFGRAWLLAKLLQGNYDIEVVGPAFGHGIWKPLKNLCDFKIRTVKGFANGQFEFKKLLSMISGDVIYTSKPRMGSFGVGLVKKIGARKPLVLDIDDWELGFGKDFYDSLIWYKKINDFRLSFSNWTSHYYVHVLNKLIPFANEVTVSGTVLNQKYGGTIIPHVRDISIFDSNRYDRNKLKKKYFNGRNKKNYIVGFLGTPRPHKGVEDIVDAMALLKDKDILLIIVGVDEDSYCIGLKKRVKHLMIEDKVLFIGQQPFEKLPEFISILDLVVIPQREQAASIGQVPAKIFDAMAMEKPIIGTKVSEIPDILDNCGWVVQPNNPEKLKEAIMYVFDHPIEARERGKKARKKCMKDYSWGAMENKLIMIFEKFIKGNFK